MNLRIWRAVQISSGWSVIQSRASRPSRLRLKRPRRGVTLLFFFAGIPAALFLFLLVLNRIDIAAAEARRAQARTQSRLLAESAIARLMAEGKTAKALQGKIDGAGEYAVEVAGREGGAARLVFRGEIDGSRIASAGSRIVCEIKGELREKARELALFDPAWRIQPSEFHR